MTNVSHIRGASGAMRRVTERTEDRGIRVTVARLSWRHRAMRAIRAKLAALQMRYRIWKACRGRPPF